MKRSWIKLYRDIIDDWLYSASKREPFDKFHAYMDIYLHANFKQNTTIYQGQVQETMPGQMRTSTEALAHRWFWSAGKVRRFLSVLEANGKIQIERTQNGTLITIKEWTSEQGKNTAGSSGSVSKKNRKEEVPDDGNIIPF